MNTRMKRSLLRFRKDQDGNATIEFVLLFPVFMSLFLMGFEAGYFMVRSVLVERAVDISVRDVRLGNGNVPDYVALRKSICDEIAIIPDCLNAVQVDMKSIEIEPGGTVPVSTNTECINQDDTDFDVGDINQMMIVRVCVLAQPLFPTTGIGVGMQYYDGKYRMITTAGFVNEPGNRSGPVSTPPALLTGG
ncbi:pilus assembly protein [bacterium]|nr:pilus assembly protein [bacterium]